ncbi:hypothetical protein FBZ94_102329 [Bradyrhizobium sacchari]|nr:hypothetical protein FBZ94_102329 [Bradyrhizobium sacchari]
MATQDTDASDDVPPSYLANLAQQNHWKKPAMENGKHRHFSRFIKCWDMAAVRKMRPKSTWKTCSYSKYKVNLRFSIGIPILDACSISGSTRMFLRNSIFLRSSLRSNATRTMLA